MRIRTRVAGALAGTAFAGLTALAIGTAAPAGAQPVQPTHQSVSAAPQHSQCWGDDCWDDWGDDGWYGGWGGDWGGGWYGW